MYVSQILQAVKKNALEAREDQFPPTLCITEPLESWLKCNNSIFNNKHFLLTDGTTGDIAIEQFDKKALEYYPPIVGWKKFQFNIF